MMNDLTQILIVLGYPAKEVDAQFFNSLSSKFKSINLQVLSEPSQQELYSSLTNPSDILCFLLGDIHDYHHVGFSSVLLSRDYRLDFDSFHDPSSDLGDALHRQKLKLILFSCPEGLEIALKSEDWPHNSKSIIFDRSDSYSSSDDIIKEFLENLLYKYDQKYLQDQAVLEVWALITHQYNSLNLPIFFQGKWYSSRQRSTQLIRQDLESKIYLDDYWRFFARKALIPKIKLSTDVITDLIVTQPQIYNSKLDKFNQVYLPSRFETCNIEETFRAIKNQQFDRVVIIGEQGSGKTTCLQKMAQWVFEKTDQDIAIYISLKELEEQSLEQYLIDTWLENEVFRGKIQAKNKENYMNKLQKLFNRKRVWLFLDGVDEIKSSSPLLVVKSGIQNIESWLKDVHHIKILLSCRSNVWNISGNPLLELSPRFIVYSPKKFKYPDDVNKFIDNWFNSQDKSQLGNKLKEQLKSKIYSPIQELICRPFFLASVCIFWQRENQLQNRRKLYNFLIYLLYVWKQKPNYDIEFGEQTPEQKELETPLSDLALAILKQERKTLDMSNDLVSKYLGEQGKMLAKNLGILSFSSNKYSFPDTFLYSYYAANGIKNQKDIIDFESHTYHIFNPKYQEVITLWFDLITYAEKVKFINNLEKFKDKFTYYNFYLYRLYFFLFKLIINTNNQITSSKLYNIFIHLLSNITRGQRKNYKFVIQEIAELGFKKSNTLNVIKNEAKEVLLKIDEQLIIKQIKNEELKSRLTAYFNSIKQPDPISIAGLEPSEDIESQISALELKERLVELIDDRAFNMLYNIIGKEKFEKEILYFLPTFKSKNKTIILKNLQWKLTQYLSPLEFCQIFHPEKYNQLNPKKYNLPSKLPKEKPMLPGFEQRLQQLQKNINQELELLEEYEEVLRYIDEDDIRKKKRCLREIERQKQAVDKYQQEYAQLQQQSTQSSPQMEQIHATLQQMEQKINFIQKGQVATYKLLSKTHQDLLARYEKSEQVIIGEITKKLKESDLKVTQKLLEAVETNRVSDVQMEQMLTVIEQQLPLPALPPAQSEPIAEIIKDPELDIKHRLNVALPIVPLLINYEAEIELGSGFNLSNTWERLIQKLRR